eukprot:EG_transcript_23729
MSASSHSAFPKDFDLCDLAMEDAFIVPHPHPSWSHRWQSIGLGLVLVGLLCVSIVLGSRYQGPSAAFYSPLAPAIALRPGPQFAHLGNPAHHPVRLAAAPVEGPLTLRKLMEDKLFSTFNPICCQVIDESRGHGSPPGVESHFKVVIVTEAFDGKRLVQRHKMVNQAFDEAFRLGLHALTITAKTPEEWAESGGAVADSPRCQGHSDP